jgi:uncharacterized membrane protein HdeD (DUF308 family)
VIELMSRHWWVLALRGAIAVLFGVMAIVWPGITVLALVVLWGIYAVIDGITGLSMAFTARRVPDPQRWLYGLLGLAGLIAGLISIFWPEITALVLLVIIASWAVVAGVLQLIAAFRLRKEITGEWFLALSGAVCIVLGVLLFTQPTTGAVALVLAIATFALVWGVSLILLGFRLRKVGRQLAANQPI